MKKLLLKLNFSGAVLKWIAIVTMAIDHFGATVLETYVLDYHGISPIMIEIASWDIWNRVDLIMRYVGRTCFPIIAFLLVEGAIHTSNVKKYALRLGIFALISEIPFDLAFHNQPFYFESQNVFFTLLLGLAAIELLMKFNTGRKLWIGIIGLFALTGVAYFIHSDYGTAGVLVIGFMYLFRDDLFLSSIFSWVILGISNAMEAYALPGFIVNACYNLERGKQNKYFFYIFYPAHLLLFWVIGALILPMIIV